MVVGSVCIASRTVSQCKHACKQSANTYAQISCKMLAVGKRTKYPDLAALIERGLTAADPPLNKTEFGVASGLGRQIAGRIVRGEQIPEPSYVAKIVAVLPMTTEEILKACGFTLGVPSAKRVPTALVDAYVRLSPEDQRQIVKSARALAAYRPDRADPS